MPRQKHDLGVIKRETGTKPYPPEKLRRERRKRSLPFLYPGWDEDRRAIRDVKISLKSKLQS